MSVRPEKEIILNPGCVVDRKSRNRMLVGGCWMFDGFYLTFSSLQDLLKLLEQKLKNFRRYRGVSHSRGRSLVFSAVSGVAENGVMVQWFRTISRCFL